VKLQYFLNAVTMPKGVKGKGGHPIPKVTVTRDLTAKQGEELLKTLEKRFEDNKDRHTGVVWSNVQSRLMGNNQKLSSLFAMECTGGEPDVIAYDKETDEYIFCDCSKQSPSGRRSICYDRLGEEARIKKGIHPGGNAIDLAESMGIELLTEGQYNQLQKVGSFDTTTSSWLKTPEDIRDLGGALFADFRYDHVFVYHNGAESFYSARGFRGLLRV